MLLTSLLAGCSQGDSADRDGTSGVEATATGMLESPPPDPDFARCAVPEGAATNVGEGCARLDAPATLAAGSRERLSIDVTVGPSGIALGGGVAIGLHHAAEWRVQVERPELPGFVAAAATRGTELRLERFEYAPTDMFWPSRPSFDSDSIHHRVLRATVYGEPLLPGDVVRFALGANEEGVEVLPYVDPDHEFRISTDVDGDGRYEALARSPRIAIVPGEPAELAGFLPSHVELGTPVTLHLRLEDAHHNLVETADRQVTVSDEGGSVLARGVALETGVASVDVTLRREGPHRLRLSSDDGAVSGRSNPLRAVAELPATRLWWADLHGHTSVSDGLGPGADEYFRFGREVTHLDVVALTDHGHFDWPANIAAVKRHHAPGEFVTLLAQEAGAGPDHMNIYYRRDDTEHLSQWHQDYGELQAWVDAQFNADGVEAMMAPHHFAYDRGFGGDDAYPFGTFDESLVRFVEVYSAHGTSEYPGNPRPLAVPSDDHTKYLQHALDHGLKFGVIAASDNHDSHPGRSGWGRYAGGLAGIWAPELTREAIWEALHERRTYGTSLDRIYMELSLDGEPMGSTVAANGPVRLEAYVIGKRDEVTVELLRDNAVIATRASDDGVASLVLDVAPSATESHFYLRVTQGAVGDDEYGERAWSSPVWLAAR